MRDPVTKIKWRIIQEALEVDLWPSNVHSCEDPYYLHMYTHREKSEISTYVQFIVCEIYTINLVRLEVCRIPAA